jgi:glc operon protein GlcG
MLAATRPTIELTHVGALRMIEAAVAKASAIGFPVDIVVVDAGGQVVASLRMSGAFVLSMETATAKARTAASHRRPTTEIDAENAAALSRASGGVITHMAGGLPIVVDGVCVGGIGIGSAPDAEDIAIAQAALAAIGAQGRMPA